MYLHSRKKFRRLKKEGTLYDHELSLVVKNYRSNDETKENCTLYELKNFFETLRSLLQLCEQNTSMNFNELLTFSALIFIFYGIYHPSHSFFILHVLFRFLHH